jgi:hypothetical protein
MHFACHMEGLVPDFKINMTRWRHPPDRDCRDMLDLNMAMLLLNAVCGSAPAGEEPAALVEARTWWWRQPEKAEPGSDTLGAPSVAPPTWARLRPQPSLAHVHRHFTTAWLRWR